MGYLKIFNLYKDQNILMFKQAYAMEKIHGTSAHIYWDSNNFLYFFHGGAKHEEFVKLFNKEEIKNNFEQNFIGKKVFIYGEAYGGKIQNMKHIYGPNLKFVVFDVRIDDKWLNVPEAENIAKQFNLEFVHYNKINTEMELIDKERDSDSQQAIRNGMGEGKIREGIVLRPLEEFIKNNGERVIAKHKREEFKERQKVPKVTDNQKLEVLTKAKEIATEWVTLMRLNHVLQKNLNIKDMSNTKDLILAMIEDIYIEAKGEIVESKEVASAIGTKTAQLWKKYLINGLNEDN